MTLTVQASSPFSADALFGPSFSGLGTVGVQIVDANGGVVQARTTSGVAESPAGSGDYVKNFAAAPTGAAMYRLAWDTGGGVPQWAFEDLIITAAPASLGVSGGGVGGRGILYAGDQQPSLPAVITKQDGSVVDLTGYLSVTFALRAAYSTTNVFESAAAFVAPRTSGQVRYDFAANDLNVTPGVYVGQWTLVDATSKPQHVRAGEFEVRAGF